MYKGLNRCFTKEDIQKVQEYAAGFPVSGLIRSPVVISDPTVPAAPAPDRDLRAIAFVSGEFLVDSASVKLPEMKETKKYVYYSSFPDGFIVERKALCSPWILPS